MIERSTPEHRAVRVSVILLGCLGVTAIVGSDVFYFQTGLLGEGLPDFSPGRLLRSAIIFLSLVVIAFGFTGGWPRTVEMAKNAGDHFARPSILGALCVAGLFLLLFLIDPVVFNEISLEDGPIEWGLALLLLCCCVVFMMSFAKARTQAQVSAFTMGMLALLAFVFFIIAMEELSWFQRMLGLETSDMFAGNEQREMNLHNFATDRIENAYYFGAFLFLVVLPILRILFPATAGNRHVTSLIPRPFIAVIGAIACAYNFDMWNILFTQIAFFGSIIALSLLALLSASDNDRIVVVGALLLLMTTQTVFLVNGDDFYRLWTVTEYKEFLIPLGFLAYSVSVYRNITCSVSSSDEQQR